MPARRRRGGGKEGGGKEGGREEARKGGREEGRKEGRKENATLIKSIETLTWQVGKKDSSEFLNLSPSRVLQVVFNTSQP